MAQNAFLMNFLRKSATPEPPTMEIATSEPVKRGPKSKAKASMGKPRLSTMGQMKEQSPEDIIQQIIMETPGKKEVIDLLKTYAALIES